MSTAEGPRDYNRDIETIGYPLTQIEREYTTRNPVIALARVLTNLKAGVRLVEPEGIATDEFYLVHGRSSEIPKATIIVTPFGEQVIERIRRGNLKFILLNVAYDGHNPLNDHASGQLDDEQFKRRVVALYFEHISAELRASDMDFTFSPLPPTWKGESPDEAKVMAPKWLAGDEPLTAGEIHKEVEAIVREEFPELFPQDEPHN